MKWYKREMKNSPPNTVCPSSCNQSALRPLTIRNITNQVSFQTT